MGKIKKLKYSHRLVKESEKKIASNRDMYPLIINNTDAFIVIIDLKGNYKYVSPSHVKLGYKPEELITKNGLKLIHPEDQKKLISLLTKASTGFFKIGYTQTVEYRFPHKKGGYRHITATGNLILDKDGKLAILMVARDSTKEKREEKESRQKSDDLYLINLLNTAANRGDSFFKILCILSQKIKTMFNSSGALVRLMSEDNKYLEWHNPNDNPEITKKLKNILGINILTIKIPFNSKSKYFKILKSKKSFLQHDRKFIRKMMDEVNVEDNFSSEVFRAVFKKSIPLMIRALKLKYLIFLPLILDKKIIGVMEITRQEPYSRSDVNRLALIANQFSAIVNHILSEKKLKKSEEKFRNVIDQSYDGYMLTNEQGKVTEWNKSMEIITGWEKQKILGRNVVDVQFSLLLPNEKTKKVYANYTKQFNHYLKTGQSQNPKRLLKRSIMRKNGTYCVIQTSDHTIKTLNGYMICVLIKDITEIYQAENLLRQSQKMDALGQLSGSIAHEFNNFLTGIMGYTDILSEEVEDNPSHVQYLNNISNMTERAASLTSKLLSFARDNVKETEAINIRFIVNETIELLKHLIDRRITIKSHLPIEPLYMKGDQSLIQNVLINLALNAQDAISGAGILNLTISLKNLDGEFIKGYNNSIRPGSYIQIKISDTGKGIEKETLPYIFDPFFTTKRNGKGTGLGLAIVHKTISDCKGIINVESSRGKGTTFIIYLPQVKKKLGKKIIKEQTEKKIKGSGCILLVDDEKIIREMAKEILIELGYDVLIAKDGHDAISVYKKHYEKIKLVIMDMIMPGLSGLDTFFKLKIINSKIQAVISSGYHMGIKIQEFKNAGIKGIIQKPYKIIKFSKEVAKFVK